MSDGRYHKPNPPEWVDPSVDEMLQIMREGGWTWARLVEASGVPLPSLMNWRGGKRTPSVAGIRQALNAMGYDLAVVPLAEVENDGE